MNDDDVRKLRAQAKRRAKRTRLGHEAEDFASVVVLKRLEGSTATIDELWIDFCRKDYGDTRSKYRKEQKRLYPKNVQKMSHKLAAREETGRDVGFESILKFLSDNGAFFSQRDRACISMKYRWGMTHTEIAEAFGVTNNTVTSIFQEVDRRLRLILQSKPPKKAA